MLFEVFQMTYFSNFGSQVCEDITKWPKLWSRRGQNHDIANCEQNILLETLKLATISGYLTFIGHLSCCR